MKEKIEDILQMEGVMAKGYGRLAKFAMQDPNLTITAKGLYAYLCSLTGGGATTWPRRETIMGTLQISKDTYYASYKNLLKEGYLTVDKKRTYGQWSRNYYHIVMNPKRFQEVTAETDQSEYAKIRFSGMMSYGYGSISRLVMQDSRLSVKEKALYAYMITYASSGEAAFPKVSSIIHHLQINKQSYRKYMNTLCSLGYIEKKQRRSGGRFGVFDYYIVETPAAQDAKRSSETKNQDTVSPGTKNQDTVSPGTKKQGTVSPETKKPDMASPGMKKQDTVSPGTKNQDTVSPGTKKPDTIKPDTKNQDIYIIPVLSNTNLSNTTCDEEDYAHTRARAAPQRDAEQQQLKRDMLQAGGIPPGYLGDVGKTTAALYTLCEYDGKGQVRYFDPEQEEAWQLVIRALRQLCCRASSKVANRRISNRAVVQKLNSLVERYGDELYLSDLMDYLVSACAGAIQDRANDGEAPLRKPVNYTRYVVWTALNEYRPPEEKTFAANGALNAL